MTIDRNEQYSTPAGVDTSLPALEARLRILQPELEQLMDKALGLFDDVYPQAPHPAHAKKSPVYAVHTMDICPVEGVPMGRELTVVLGSSKWIRVFRNAESSSDRFPRQRLWVSRPEDEAHRRINVIRTHNPRRKEYPYDVETVDYNERGMCIGYVNGASYYGQEPFITEADLALDNARKVAEEKDFVRLSTL